MKIYVAGSSKEAKRARDFMHLAREVGAEVVGDWTKHIEDVGGIPDTEHDPMVLRDAAKFCEDAVCSADLLVALIPPKSSPSAGMWFEMGIARSLGVNIWISQREITGSDEPRQFCIFNTFANAWFDSDSAALVHLMLELEGEEP